MRAKHSFSRSDGLVVATAVLFFGLVALVYADFVPGVPAPGHELSRIVCYSELPESYWATVYATGLDGPDGLAFDSQGNLYVAEEGAGRVVQVAANNVITPVLTNLAQPEGIAFDTADNLYVVEDVADGRLLRRAPNGTITIMATGLVYPEGVTVADDGTVYVTQSDLETLNANSSVTDVQNARSSITAFASNPPYTPTVLINTGPDITFGSPVVGRFWSYADLTVDDSTDTLYVSNELGGIEIITDTVVSGFPVTLVFTNTEGILSLDLNNPTNLSVVSESFVAPEGIHFIDVNGPLLVAEEDSNGPDEGGEGRVSQLYNILRKQCTGFDSIEDVVGERTGSSHTYYISEDGTGQIILLKPDDATPTPAPSPIASATPTATNTPSATPTLTATAMSTPPPTVSVTPMPSATPTAGCQAGFCLYLPAVRR